MKAKFALALVATLALFAPAAAQTPVVDEKFDGYADRAAFLAQWVPTIGNGTVELAPSDANYLAGLLTDDAEFPSAIPNVQGKAVDHIGASASTPGMVNQYGGVVDQAGGQQPAFSIAPSATQSVFLSADIYDGASGNERMTVGLRYIDFSGATVVTENILEMGFYNSNSADPTVEGSANPAQNAVAGSPGFYNGRGYGARVINFGPAIAPLLHQPDWQYFRTGAEVSSPSEGFAQELDRVEGDTDEFVSIGDVGAGWHRYTATITPTSVTLTIDLFRDGLKNTSRTPDEGTGVRPGTPGVDAIMFFPISPTANGFNALRIGGPSGLQSAGPGLTGFDNILLTLIHADVPGDNNADFDGDGDVDGADFLTWQRGLGLTGQTTNANGDADGSGTIDGDDLTVWTNQFGQAPPATSAVSAIPEPTTLLLAAAGMAAALGFCRRRA